MSMLAMGSRIRCGVDGALTLAQQSSLENVVLVQGAQFVGLGGLLGSDALIHHSVERPKEEHASAGQPQP